MPHVPASIVSIVAAPWTVLAWMALVLGPPLPKVVVVMVLVVVMAKGLAGNVVSGPPLPKALAVVVVTVVAVTAASGERLDPVLVVLGGHTACTIADAAIVGCVFYFWHDPHSRKHHKVHILHHHLGSQRKTFGAPVVL